MRKQNVKLKNDLSHSAEARPADLLDSLLLPTIVTSIFWLTSVQKISLFQVSCAWLLLLFPWTAFLLWKKQHRYEVSIFAIIAGMYWMYYGVALFYGDRLAPSISSNVQILADESITQAVLMADLGVIFLWIGVKTPIHSRWLPIHVPDIHLNVASMNYMRAILFVTTLIGFFPSLTYIWGEGGRQLIVAIQTSVPLVAFIILFRLYLKGYSSLTDKALLLGFFASKFIIGVSSGWLGTIVFVAIVCFILCMAERRRPPWLLIVPVLVYIVFFQAGKSAFRGETWNSDYKMGISERVNRWVTLSLKTWQDAFDDVSGEKRGLLLKEVVMRVSLLTQTANVLNYTPNEVPYQQGGTYSYLISMWIPRAIWPNKPSASDANRFYQVAYKLTAEENLENVSISVGTMTEGYINFGWFGVMLVMYGIGLLLGWIEKVFLNRNAGLFFGAIGITLTVNLIGIESQMAIYIGGLLQKMIIVFLVFLPILKNRRKMHYI